MVVKANMRNSKWPLLEIASAGAMSIGLFMAYGFLTKLLPVQYTHEKYESYPYVLESIFVLLPVVVPAYVISRYTSRSGGMIGVTTGLCAAIFGTLVSERLPNAFNPDYIWVPEHWFFVYVLIGLFSGIAGAAHGENSKKEL